MSDIRVLLVDDHELVRYGMSSLLEKQNGIKVVAQAASGEEAMQLCRDEKIDVVMMDVNMPGIGGYEATSRLSQTHPEIAVIIVTVHSDGPIPKRMLSAGAKGYLTKGSSVDEMLAAIQSVHAGKRYIQKDIAQQLALSMLPGEQDILDVLTPRELQVMMMIAQGLRTKGISETLNLSPKTVSTYRKRLHDKLGVTNDIEMVHIAIKNGLVEDIITGTNGSGGHAE